MATRKKITKGVQNTPRTVVVRTEQVPLTDLQTYHKNPRIGDPDTVAKSLYFNGQFKPIVVNIGTHTGRKNEILCGNHTYIAARRELEWDSRVDGQVKHFRKEPWETIVASFVDVDEDAAARIVLADNRTAENSTYDDAVLADIFKQINDLGSVEATGYSSEEMDDILAKATQVADEVGRDSRGLLDNIKFDAFTNDDGEIRPEADNRSSRQKYLDEREEEQASIPADPDESESTDDEPELDNVEEEKLDELFELQIVLEAREEEVYKGNNKYGIPELYPDRLLEKFPDNIGTWGGHEATPDDGKKWFLYNYSLGGLKGLPLDRSILAFNTYDQKFDSWWETPAYLTARMMNNGLTAAVVPDFSFYSNETRAHHIWSVYRAQWLGRFFQEAGLKVVPRVQFDFTDPDSLEFALLGIPVGTPTLETSVQNTNNLSDEERARYVSHLRDSLNYLKPEQVLIYGGNPGWRIFEDTGWKGKAIHCMNYAGVRRDVVYGNKKENTTKITEKQRKMVMEKHGLKKKEVQEPSEDDL